MRKPIAQRIRELDERRNAVIVRTCGSATT